MGGIEALPFGVLLFVVTMLVVANVWAVVDAKLATDAAAREAARAYVEAEVGRGTAGPAGPEAAAIEAGLAALAAHGRDPDRARVWLSSLSRAGRTATFARCTRATFTASYAVPALTVPWIGGFGQAFEVTSSHSEVVDPFRDGVPGEAASC